MCEVGYPLSPEERVRCLGAGVTGICELFDVILGYELWSYDRVVSALSYCVHTITYHQSIRLLLKSLFLGEKTQGIPPI